MTTPEFDAMVARLRDVQRVGTPTVAEMRAGWEAFAGQFIVPPGLEVTPVDAGGVAAEWNVMPAADSGKCILYLHGGGYNIGSPASYRQFTARLSEATAAPLLSVDYRLAPEHRFPAAVEDAVTAYRWLLAQGYASERIVFMGDSGGGGLVLTALIAAREQGLAMPAAGVCFSPVTDLAKTGPSMLTNAEVDPIVRLDTSAAHAIRYMGEGADLTHPLASPLYADLAGLPPLFLLVGTRETLLDDSTRFSARAKAAGVDVRLEIWPDMIHIWPFFAQILPEGRLAIEAVGAYVRAA
ncbi:alpha/beta hydrolase [Sphingosinicella microcystinivorans]|uniref:alpha/beta hydrolase n=1 Tax=Sphingosinicella microcystinivorans TaxID=335406 RepID=UPI0022F3FACB|nr:alpha/beta hydrolase [Sphingosinicella microcystinivorans]WBX85210.1 alpha/beta hydrolase [Sphingosinicella microcystinivorans]